MIGAMSRLKVTVAWTEGCAGCFGEALSAANVFGKGCKTQTTEAQTATINNFTNEKPVKVSV
jgi:hypothetical protein